MQHALSRHAARERFALALEAGAQAVVRRPPEIEGFPQGADPATRPAVAPLPAGRGCLVNRITGHARRAPAASATVPTVGLNLESPDRSEL